ncbi:MAG: hypothetical protein IID45_11995, partial [Planctomycetes bacterium]|nr:hypothetical protein [Planctomycetota bacterium]
SVQVWNLAAGKPQRKIVTPSAINALTLNKDATLVITAGSDNILRVWKTAAPAPTKKPAGKKKSKKKVKKNAKKTVKKQPQGEKPVVEMKGHSKPVTSVALILPAGTQVVSGSEDGSVRIWTLSNGRLSRSMNHCGPVTGVAVRPDGQFIASAGANSVAKLWQASNGKQIAEMKGNPKSRRSVARLMERQAVAKQKASSANSVVKAAEKNVKDRTAAAKKAKDAKTAADKALAALEKKAKPILGKLTAAKAAAGKKPKDNNLKKAVTTAKKAADKANADVKKSKDAQSAAARTVQLSNKSVVTANAKIAAAKKEKTAKDAQQKKVDIDLKTAQTADKAAGKPLRSIAFSSEGKWLVTGGDDNTVNVFSGTDGRHLETFAGHQSPVTAVAVGAKGTLLSGSADKTVISWNPRPAWKLIGRLGATQSAPLDLSTAPFVGRILSLAFSPDGRKLATGGGDASRSGELMIWDVQKKTLIREIKDAHSDTILGLEFSPDGKQILSGSTDKFAKIFDVATGKKIRSFEGHTHHVLDVSWQADGSVIATAGADNVIKLWNVATGEQKRTITGHKKQVTSVQFIGISTNVVSCGGDMSVRFNKNNGQTYRRFSGGTDYMYASAAARDAGAVIKSVSGEATVVIAGGEDGVLRVWTGAGKTIKNFDPPKSAEDEKTQANAKGKAKK